MIVYSNIFYSARFNTGGSLIKHTLKGLLHDFRMAVKSKSRVYNYPFIKGREMFYVKTYNQYRSLYPVSSNVDNSILVTERDNFFNKGVGVVKLNYSFSLKKYLFLIRALWRRELTPSYASSVLTKFHVYKEWMNLLSQNKPHSIIVSNDHSPPIRALVLAGYQLKIPVFYLQHAAVTEIFPPLHFRASFLFGQHSYDTYKKKEYLMGQVFLTGNHMIEITEDDLVDNEKIKNIGVAFSLKDSVGEVSELISFLTNTNNSYNYIVRAHPREKRDHSILQKLANKSVGESTIDFCKRIDVLISSDSSIMLEAALCNVRVIYLNMNHYELNDSYGFVKNGLAEKVNSREEIPTLLHSDRKPGKYYYRKRAKYYDASIGSFFEFNSLIQTSNLLNREISLQK